MQKLHEPFFKSLTTLTLIALTTLFGLLAIFGPEGFLGELMTNMAATSLYVLIAYFTYDVVKRIANKELTKEAQIYAEAYIAPHIFSILMDVMNILYKKSEIPYIDLLGQLRQSTHDLSGKLSNRRYMGFDLLQNTEIVSKDTKELLENSFLLSRLDDQQVLILVKLDNRLRELRNTIADPDNRSLNNTKSTRQYKVIAGHDISKTNGHLPERRILLETIGDTNKGIVRSFGDFSSNVSNEELLKHYSFNDRGSEQVAAKVHEIFRLIKEWTEKSEQGLTLRLPN